MGCSIGMQLHSHGLVKNLRHGLHKRDVTTFPRSSEKLTSLKYRIKKPIRNNKP